jgi:hypothetical protein
MLRENSRIEYKPETSVKAFIFPLLLKKKRKIAVIPNK